MASKTIAAQRLSSTNGCRQRGMAHSLPLCGSLILRRLPELWTFACMNAKSHENLRAIHFEGELLPSWAQLLDFAARLCPVSEEVRKWFSKFTARSGVDDARTVVYQCGLLRESIEARREFLVAELQRTGKDSQPSQILGAWVYALETMIQEARTRTTCSWTVEGTDDEVVDDSDGGDITLRRV